MKKYIYITYFIESHNTFQLIAFDTIFLIPLNKKFFYVQMLYIYRNKYKIYVMATRWVKLHEFVLIFLGFLD